MEALNEIKNPRPVAFIKQQTNVAAGHQQVNNHARGGSDFLPNELKGSEAWNGGHPEARRRQSELIGAGGRGNGRRDRRRLKAKPAHRATPIKEAGDKSSAN